MSKKDKSKKKETLAGGFHEPVARIEQTSLETETAKLALAALQRRGEDEDRIAGDMLDELLGSDDDHLGKVLPPSSQWDRRNGSLVCVEPDTGLTFCFRPRRSRIHDEPAITVVDERGDGPPQVVGYVMNLADLGAVLLNMQEDEDSGGF